MRSTVRQVRLDPRAPLVVDVHELGRRPGTMRTVGRTVPAPDDLGNGVIGVGRDSDLELDLRIEAVMEGVLVSGTAEAEAVGECVRCLDPLTHTVRVDLQELFLYEPPEDAADDAELPLLEGDLLDLEPTIRDAVVPSLPFQPLCDESCPGLCGRCGVRLAEDPEHAHGESDPRWASLAALGTVLAEREDPAVDPSEQTPQPDQQTAPTTDDPADPAGTARPEEENT